MHTGLRFNLHGTGLGEGGLPVDPVDVVTGEMWLAAAHTLGRIGKLGARSGVTFCLENLNTEVDHPGVPFARAADTLALASIASLAQAIRQFLNQCQLQQQ